MFTSFLGNVAADSNCAVGLLSFDILESANLQTLDKLSPPSNISWTVSQGSWGDIPSSFHVSQESPSRARAIANPPLLPFKTYSVSQYLIQWSTFANFSDVSVNGGAVSVPSTLPYYNLTYQIQNLVPLQPYYFRVAASSFNASVWNPFLLCPTNPIILQLPVIQAVSTSTGEYSLPSLFKLACVP